ncbi:hypothetical protein EK21DRAFT_109209 [Setomelanomma holmii]|uniref:Uncharacterized protein n=1 Tax=Setomelanomma holmii TaxID=210430 RepID=A0A9P4LRS4_9PLEO|nr:hypothetical protein EK21DRAFT_109209 [Setomelanomma holmii]
MTYCLHNVTGGVEQLIKEKGGGHKWRESCLDPMKSVSEQTEEMRRHRAATWGEDNSNMQNVLMNGYGHDVSHRHSKKRLFNHTLRVRQLKQLEQEWSKDHAITGTEDWHKYTARAALTQYRAAEATGKLHQIERLDLAFARKRGREHEIATDHNYPKDEDEERHTHTYNQKSLAQALFILASKVPEVQPKGKTIAQSWPSAKCQRRNNNAKVSVASEIAICTVNDVDDIRKTHANKLSKGNRHVPSPGPGILRTATPNAVRSSSGLDMSPKLEYFTHSVKPFDGPRQRKGNFWRGSSGYRAETSIWKASQGSENVNTSNNQWPVEKWSWYVNSLQGETHKWDEEEAEERTKGIKEEENEEKGESKQQRQVSRSSTGHPTARAHFDMQCDCNVCADPFWQSSLPNSPIMLDDGSSRRLPLSPVCRVLDN